MGQTYNLVHFPSTLPAFGHFQLRDFLNLLCFVTLVTFSEAALPGVFPASLQTYLNLPHQYPQATTSVDQRFLSLLPVTFTKCSSYCQSSSIFLMPLAICRSLSEFLCGYSSNVKSPSILSSSSVCSHFLPLITWLVFQCIYISVSYVSGLITGDCASTWWHNFVFWVFSSLLLLIIHNI